jgi:hypothetical protein
LYAKQNHYFASTRYDQTATTWAAPLESRHNRPILLLPASQRNDELAIMSTVNARTRPVCGDLLDIDLIQLRGNPFFPCFRDTLDRTFHVPVPPNEVDYLQVVIGIDAQHKATESNHFDYSTAAKAVRSRQDEFGIITHR